MCIICNEHSCDCDELETSVVNTSTVNVESGHIPLSDYIDTISNQNNGSVFDKDTINGSFGEVFEASNLYGSEVDKFQSSDNDTSSLSDTLHDPSRNTKANTRPNLTHPLLTLKCGSLNVCGIKRKMLYPEFCDLICEYDLFCVTETKTDNHDRITLPGYKFLSQCRKQNMCVKVEVLVYL